MIRVTLEFETAVDAAAFLQDFDGSAAEGGEVATAVGKPRGRPRKEGLTPAQVAAANAATAAAAQPATVQTTAAASPAASAVPFKAVADAITELADVSRDKAVAVLAKFGAKLASELKPEQYADVVAAAKAGLAAAPTSLI